MSSASPTAARSSRAAAVLVALMAAASVVACGPSRAGSMTGAAPAEACLLTADDPEGRGSRSPSRIEMGLAGEVNPATAPLPGNPDEALLHRLLYEPLVRVDCTGRHYPGLASRWQASDGGRTWTFVLREDARFWNGDPVRAPDVVESWEAADEATADLWGDRTSPIVEVLDERRLQVTFSEESSEVPGVLGRTELATVRRVDGAAWPVMGTGPYRVADAWRQDARGRRSAFARPGRDSGGSGTLELERVGGAEAGPATIRVRIEPGGDGRDLLAAGVDVLVTDDARTLDYASIRPGLSALPLPWSRTYVLAIRVAAGMDADAATIPGDFLEDLARDVVRSEARPTRPGARAGGSRLCLREDPDPSRTSDGPRSAEATGPETRIVHLREDRDAAAIAERLVALATSPSIVAPATDTLLSALGLSARGTDRATPPPIAAPVEVLSLPDELLLAGIGPRPAIGSGGAEDEAFAYVFGIPRTPGSGCPRGPEAASSDPEMPPARSIRVDSYRIHPLVDTRRRAIVRSPGATFTVDADATLFFAPAEGGER